MESGEEWLWIGIGACSIGLGLWTLRPLSQKRKSKKSNAWARVHMARVDPSLQELLDRYLRRERVIKSWFSIVLGAAIVGIVAGLSLDHHQTVVLFWVSLTAAGSALTTATALVMAALAKNSPSNQMARTKAVTPTDYAPVAMRIVSAFAGVCSALLAFALIVSAILAGSLSLAKTAGIASGTLVALAAYLAEWSAQRIASTPQPAVDAAHLYWLDALRSDAIKQAYIGVPLWAGQVFASLIFVFDQPPAVAWLGAFAMIMLALVSALSGTSPVSFRRKLWPTLASGQVLLPGELPPPRSAVGAA